MAAVLTIIAVMLLAAGLTIVELRRITPLAFRCLRCNAEFQQPPHHDYPRTCPQCGALDWSAPNTPSDAQPLRTCDG